MKPIDYLLLQMELEGITRCGANLISRISPSVNDFPLALYALTSDQSEVTCFDKDLSPSLLNVLIETCGQSFRAETMFGLFHTAGINTNAGHFKTYTFPDSLVNASFDDVTCFHRDDPKVTAFGFSGLAAKVFAVERDGMIVSACVSSRQNSKGGEAWVFTQPVYRRKGFAQRVVTAWASVLHRAGVIPFYSHHAENLQSAALAKKLNLIYLFEEIVIERTK